MSDVSRLLRSKGYHDSILEPLGILEGLQQW
jgi:hypothetical protein